jgi:chromosome segregation ATPase
MKEQATLGIKMDAEIKEHWQQKIAGSGMTAAEYLSTLENAYESAHDREALIDDHDLKLIENHLARIGEIAVGMAKARKDENESSAGEMEEVRKQLTGAKAEAHDAKKAAKAEIESITEQMADLQEQLCQAQSKADNEIIEAVNAKVKAGEDAAQSRRMFETLDQVNQQLQQQVNESHSALNALKAELESARKQAYKSREAEAVAADLRRQLAVEKENSARQSAELKQQYELEKRQAVLNAQAEAMDQRKAMMDELESLRRELLALRTENAEWKSKSGRGKAAEKITN